MVSSGRSAGSERVRGWRGAYMRWAPRVALALGALWLLPPAVVLVLSGFSAAAESGALQVGSVAVLWLPEDPGERGWLAGTLLLHLWDVAFVRLGVGAGTALALGVGAALVAGGGLMRRRRRAGWWLLGAALGTATVGAAAGASAALGAALAARGPAPLGGGAAAAVGLMLTSALVVLHALVRPYYR